MVLKLGIVVPCFNEEQVLPETHRQLAVLLDRMCASGDISPDSGIYFVDDGSGDRTWSEIEDLCMADGRVHGIKLSRNCGHQAALLAGLHSADGDALVSIDADLQDDVSIVAEMVAKHRAGADIVYGIRRARDADTRFKRWTAMGFYHLLSTLGVEMVFNHADYRLMSRRAVDALRDFGEVNLFLRGIIPLLGFRTETAAYDRAERFAGKSKYPLRKMMSFAVDGITSFSVVPLRLITLVGFVVSVLSFLMIVWVLYSRLVADTAIPGWASSVIPIYFLGGIQLISVGVLGEYVGKIYLESKHRPRYFVEKTVSRQPPP